MNPERVWIADNAVLPDRVCVDARIAVRGDRIDGLEVTDPMPNGAERLAGTLLPGFVDLQVNGAGGRSIDEATPDALDAVAQAVWDGGAVAFLPTLITAEWRVLLEQVRAVASWCRSWSGHGAEPLGLHLEGPFLSTPGAHPPEHFVDPTDARLDELLTAADGCLRLVTLGHARAGAAAATRRLTAAGVTVALGHCDAPDGFTACVDAGASAVTHLFNVMGRMHHRDVGVAALALDEPRVACPLIADGVHVAPAMVRLACRAASTDRIVLVTDAVAAAGMPDGDYELSGIAVRSRDGVVRDANGNLAGSALTMALAARRFQEMVPDAGAWTLAQVASRNPARLIGATRHGSIAPGKAAAFTLLAADGSLRCVR